MAPMNAVTNPQVWYWRRGNFYAKSLDSLCKQDDTDCDICAAAIAQQLAHLKTANHIVNRSFQLCYGDRMGPYTPVTIGGDRSVSKVTDEYTMWTTVYLLSNKN